MLKAHFVHEHEARPIFRLHGLPKRAAQSYDPFGVAFGGVNAFFLRPQPRLSTARRSAGRLRAGPPAATKAARTSSSVASGCWPRQTSNCARPAGASRGAGPPHPGKAATEPVVRWRGKSLSKKAMETRNRAATW